MEADRPRHRRGLLRAGNLQRPGLAGLRQAGDGHAADRGALTQRGLSGPAPSRPAATR